MRQCAFFSDDSCRYPAIGRRFFVDDSFSFGPFCDEHFEILIENNLTYTYGEREEDIPVHMIADKRELCLN